MKFTADVKALHRAINQVGINAGKGNITPLSLTAVGDQLIISSQHIYESRSVIIPAVVEAEGIAIGMFQSIKTQFGRIGGKSVTVELSPDHKETGRLSAQFDICRSQFPFRYDFGDVPEATPRTFHLVAEMPAQVFLELVGVVRHAQHDQPFSYNPNLEGIHFTPEGDGVRVATTDGHRLMIARHNTQFSHPVFLNGDMVGFLAAAIPAKSEDVVQIYLDRPLKNEHGVKLGEDHVRVVCGGVISQDVSDDRFPNYPAIIPKRGGNVQITLTPGTITPLLTAIRKLGTERSRCGAVMEFGFNNSMRVASASNLFETEIEGVAEFTGTVKEPVKIIAAAKYMLEAMPHLGAAPVLEAKDGITPIAMYGSKGEMETCAVIMPMRI